MKQYNANGHAMPEKSDGVTKLQRDELFQDDRNLPSAHTDRRSIKPKDKDRVTKLQSDKLFQDDQNLPNCTPVELRKSGRITQSISDQECTANVPLMYGECTKGVLKRYCKGTTEVLRRYYRGTKDIPTACTSPVHPDRRGGEVLVGLQTYGHASVRNQFVPQHNVYDIRRGTPTYIVFILIFICCLFNNAALAQSQDTLGAVNGVEEIRPLEVGDTIPEALWNMPLQVVNHPDGKDTITLNDYRDKKLIILDFWATWCGPCIKSLDKINEFFDQYQDDLLLAAVTREKHDKVAASMDRHGWKLWSAIEENTLHQYFPHKVIPHHVWINDGKVLAITAPEYAKPTNIEAVLAGSTVQFYHKTERLTDMESSERTEPNTSFLYFSAFKPFTDQIAVRSSVVTGSIKCDNHSLKQLYTKAFSPLLSRQMHDPVEWRVGQALFDQIEGKRMFRDGSFENDQKYMEWADHFFYSYILEFDRGSKEQLYEIFQRDLNNFFGPLYGIRGEIKECSVPSFILTTSPHDKRPQKLEESKGVANGYRLVTQIKRMFPTHAVVVEDTLLYDQDFDLDLLSFSDQEKLMRSLKEQGVVCTMEQRKFNKLIIKSEDQ